MYRLGMILYWMMTQRLPCLLSNVRSDSYRKIPSKYSEDIVKLMKKLLKEYPEDRPSELAEVFYSQYMLFVLENIKNCNCLSLEINNFKFENDEEEETKTGFMSGFEE